jgi:hypothetical protein
MRRIAAIAALIALARRRIDVLHAILQDGAFYQPTPIPPP